MEKLILFFNSFLSYVLLLAVIVLLCGIAVFIGIKLRKRKNSQLEMLEIEETKEISES